MMARNPQEADAVRSGLTPPPRPAKKATSSKPKPTTNITPQRLGVATPPRPPTPAASRNHPTPARRATGDLGSFMAAVREVESSGRYHITGPRHPRLGRPLGAYQIMESNWPNWAREAGIPGANWRDPAAQDHVARFKFQQYYNKYGDWGLVAAAWFGGEGAANRLRAGQDLSKVSDSLGTSVPAYINKVLALMGSGGGGAMQAAPAPSDRSVNAGALGAVGEFIRTGTQQPVLSERLPSFDPADVPETEGMVFPVPNGSYSNDWGAARSGGRSHEGTDIFARAGTPVLSMVGGEVVKAEYTDQGLGGKRVWVRGTDGSYYYYAHLQDVHVQVGQRVAPGDPLGTVGTSGNAKGTSPHLHLGIAKGLGKGWYNPHEVLSTLKNRWGARDYDVPRLESPAPQQPDAFDANTTLTGLFDTLSNLIAGGVRDTAYLSGAMPYFNEGELL